MMGIRNVIGDFLGPTGRAAKISSVTAESVPAAEQASVVVGGTDLDRTLLIKVPQGMPAAAAVPQDEGVAGFVASAESATRVALAEAVTEQTRIVTPEHFGAVGDGVTDDAVALQAAIDFSETFGGRVVLKGRTYASSGLLFPSNTSLGGDSAGGQVGSRSKLLYVGAAGGTLIGPKNRATNTINWKLENLDLNGGGLAGIVADYYRVSYSRAQDVAVYGAQASTGVGVLLDANVVYQCYFNVFDNVKLDGNPFGVRFQRGANANRWNGGKIGNGGTGMEFLSLSAGNIIMGTDLEESTVKHLHIDAPANVFFGLHMEHAPIGYDITANGSGTRRIATTFAATVLTYVNDLSTLSGSIDEVTPDTYAIKLGSTRIQSKMTTGATQVDINPKPFSGTAAAIINFFRDVTTTGIRQLNIYRGNGSADTIVGLDVGNRNITLGNTATTNAGGGQGVIPISNALVVPGSTPAGGGVLYVEAGALKFKGSLGTVTVIAPA